MTTSAVIDEQKATTNAIGLDVDKSKDLAIKLNDLLANYSMFYINTRGYHWNIRGDKFFELHAKFEELYTDLFGKIDEIAERVLTLGYTPKHAYADYEKTSEIKPSENVTDGYKAVEGVLNAYKVLLLKQRDILELSGEVNDEGTNSLMSDYIRDQEKQVWMYSSFLN